MQANMSTPPTSGFPVTNGYTYPMHAGYSMVQPMQPMQAMQPMQMNPYLMAGMVSHPVSSSLCFFLFPSTIGFGRCRTPMHLTAAFVVT